MRTEQEIPYRVRFTRRKTLGLYVHRNGEVEVRAPRSAARQTIVDFVKEHETWIDKHLRTIEIQPSRLGFTEHAQHFLLGELLPLTEILRVESETFSLDEEETKHQLRECYRLKAKLIFKQVLADFSPWLEEQGLETPQFRVRSMRQRWGSCSSKGHLNLNLWLVRLPIELIHYVIAHELCHLIEFNHSPRFYEKLDDLMPEWRDQKRLIETHPASLLEVF